MYAVSNNFKTAIKQSSRNVKTKIDIGAVSLTEVSIINFSIDSQFGVEGLPCIGSSTATKLTLSLMVDGITPTYFTTQSVKPYVGIEVTTGEYEYVPLGVFKVNADSVKKTDTHVDIECFDNMVFLDTFNYSTSLTFPNTIKNVLTEIQTITGFTVKNLNTLPVMNVLKMPIGNVRQVLGKMAELLTSNVLFDRGGLIEFRKVSNVSFSIDSNNYMDFKLVSEGIVTVTRIEAIQRGTDNKVIDSLFCGDSTGVTLRIENENVNTQTILNTIYNRSFPFSYYPYELNLQGMPHMDVGDVFTLTDVKGINRNLPIVSHVLNYSGGIISTFKAGAPKGTEVKSGSTGSNSITQSVNNINARVYSVEDLLAGNITSDNIQANTIKAQNLNADVFTAVDAHVVALTADKANIADLTAVKLRATSLEARAAVIDTLVAGNINASNIKAGTIAAGSSIIADGAIGNAKISSLDAAKLNAGTIDTSKVTIQGTNARMKLTGNRMQVFAAKPDLSLYERVSLGDVNGDGSIYGFRVRGADGVTTLFDENGVKREGITDGSINNAKIATDANISGAKLNIASVVTSINNGSTTIDSSKVYLDNKTLAVGFGSLATTVSTQGTTIAGHTSSIAANATAIALKVATTTYNTKMGLLDGINATNTSTLASHTASIDVLNTSITSKVSMTEVTNLIDGVQTIADNAQSSADNAILNANEALSTISGISTDITGVKSRIATAESSITQNANNIISKVNTSDFNSLNGIVTNHSSQIAQFDNKIAFSVSTVTNDLAAANAKIATINNHMTFDENGLVIGQENGLTDNLKVQIKSSEMNFLDNGVTVAKITGQQMDISKAKITKSIIIGQHILEAYNNDITLIKWIGGL